MQALQICGDLIEKCPKISSYALSIVLESLRSVLYTKRSVYRQLIMSRSLQLEKYCRVVKQNNNSPFCPLKNFLKRKMSTMAVLYSWIFLRKKIFLNEHFASNIFANQRYCPIFVK